MTAEIHQLSSQLTTAQEADLESVVIIGWRARAAMSETKFTPGPWSAGHMADQDHPCQCRSILSDVYCGSIAVVSKNNGLYIPDGGNDSPPEPEAIANAVLIAAAPDLYEALRRILPPNVQASIAKSHAKDCPCNYCFACATLAKADGRDGN